MKCNKCGKEINEQAKFCKYCGTPVQAEKQVSSANTKNGVSRKNSKTWLIIASILLGILVLTGVTAFAIKMTGEKDKATQKAEKPKQEDTVKTEESTEEPKEEPKTETPEQAFENYLVFLVDAVNSGDYTGAEKVLVKDSPLYQDQKKLVEKLYADGTKEKLTKQGIKSQEDIDDTHVRLISDEEYEITYADGTVKTVPQSYAYVCELTEQGWLLTTLEAVNGGGTSSSNKDAYIQAYQEYISANQEYLSGLKNENMTMYAIVDIQNDGVPEVLFCKKGSFTGETNFLYMGKDGTIKSYDGFYLISFDQNTGLIFSTTGGGHSAFEDGVFQYDEVADTYKEIHHGEGFLYSENGDDGNSEMTWDGVSYPTMAEYNAKVNEVFNKDAAKNPEYKDYTFDMDLLQEISDFVRDETMMSSNEAFTISEETKEHLSSFCEVLAWVDFLGETGITEASDANFSRDFAAFAFYTDNLGETGKFLLNKYGYTLDSSDGLQKIKAAKSVVEGFLYDSVGKADMTKMQYAPEGDVIVTSGSATSAGVDSVTINSITPISDTDIQIQGTANYVARGVSAGTATYTITMTENSESLYGGYMLKSIDSWVR